MWCMWEFSEAENQSDSEQRPQSSDYVKSRTSLFDGEIDQLYVFKIMVFLFSYTKLFNTEWQQYTESVICKFNLFIDYLNTTSGD